MKDRHEMSRALAGAAALAMRFRSAATEAMTGAPDEDGEQI